MGGVGGIGSKGMLGRGVGNVIGESITMAMAIVFRMFLSAFQRPFVVRREEGIGMGRGVVNLREIEAIGEGHCLFVDACSTDDKYLFVFTAMTQCLFQRGIAFALRIIMWLTAQNDVAAVG